MTRVKRPYPTNDPRLPLAGPGNSQDVGFVQTVQGAVAKATRGVAGLRDRLRYKYNEGVPTAYVGEKTFSPESATFTIDNARIGDVLNGFAPGTTSVVQYVVRDAITHTVPVILPAPGVFMARFLNVEFYQRIYGGEDNTFGPNVLSHRVMRYTLPWGKSFFNPENDNNPFFGELPPQTGKVSLLRNLTARNLTGDRAMLGINFFWNLLDCDSQRKFADDLVPHDVLLPQGFQAQLSGNLFEFGVPWLFERAGQVDFSFRLINPILQLAATEAVFPFHFTTAGSNWDDRENGGTVRNQEVTVRVELHGTKFYSQRDALLRESA